MSRLFVYLNIFAFLSVFVLCFRQQLRKKTALSLCAFFFFTAMLYSLTKAAVLSLILSAFMISAALFAARCSESKITVQKSGYIVLSSNIERGTVTITDGRRISDIYCTNPQDYKEGFVIEVKNINLS